MRHTSEGDTTIILADSPEGTSTRTPSKRARHVSASATITTPIETPEEYNTSNLTVDPSPSSPEPQFTPPSAIVSRSVRIRGRSLDMTTPKYERWTSRMERYTNANFMDAVIVEDTLREMSVRNYSNRPARESALTSIVSMNGDRIVGPTLRFPDTGVYILVSTGPLRELFDQIILACTLTESDPTTSSGSAHNRYDDNKLSYYKAISNALFLLRRRFEPAAHVYDIYSRSTFESTNRIVWNDGNTTRQ